MLLVKKANCECSIAEEKLDEFLNLGYDLINKKGEVLKKGNAQSKDDFMRENKELREKVQAMTDVIDTLKSENDTLKAKIAELEGDEGKNGDEDKTVFKCPHCGKEYASEAALNKHIKDKHQDQTTL